MSERSSTENKHTSPLHRPAQMLAYIDDSCIGCTLCIRACPEAAIVGVLRKIHTVIDALCTGCELCLAPCPVDCIQMKSLVNGLAYDVVNPRATKNHKKPTQPQKPLDEKSALQNTSKATIAKAILAATARARQKRLELPKKPSIQNQSELA